MKKLLTVLLITLFAFLLPACKRDASNSPSDRKLTRQVLKQAVEFSESQLINPEEEKSKDGLITLRDSTSKVIIDPSKIVTGNFTGDTLPDAVIPVYLFKNDSMDVTINLFMVNNDGKIMIVRAIENEMKVISIRENMIYIEIPVVKKSVPDPECLGCREVRQYTFTGDSLRLNSSATDTVRQKT